MPWYAKLLGAVVAAYALSPIDLIPDFIPVLGYLDDVIIVPIGIIATVRLIPPELIQEFRAEAARRTTRPTSRIAAMLVVALWVFAIIAVGAWAVGCGRRIPQAPNVAPGIPHVTWVLMYGDRDNADAEFACQSGPPADCAIPASRPGTQVFSDLHLYYHGAGGETRYEGTTSIGHMGTDQPYTSQTNVTVKKNESIANNSVIGIVRSAPGSYDITISLMATLTDTRKTTPIQQTIRVTLK